MRENRTQGSVRGRSGDWPSYLDSVKNYMDKIARNHHYLPQCYLKGFAKSPNKKSKLYVVDTKTGKSFCTCPRNIGAERDFNTVDLDGHPPDVIEKIFSRFETDAAKVLDNIRTHLDMPKDVEVNILMNLIAQITIRNPYIRGTIKKFQTDTVERISDLALATKDRWEAITRRMKDAGEQLDESITFEEVKKFHDEKQYTIEVANIRNIELEMSGIDAVLPTLAKRRWTVVRANERSGYFISCDMPVSLIWTNPKLQGGFYPPGHGMKSTELVFPVIKEMALIGTFEGENRVIEGNDRMIASVNSRILSFSDKQVFSSRATFSILDRHGEIRELNELSLLNNEGYTEQSQGEDR